MGLAESMEKPFAVCFADLVRMRLWSEYATTDRFAEEAGVSPEQLHRLLDGHRWGRSVRLLRCLA